MDLAPWENEQHQAYSLPFGKTSQTITRFTEEEDGNIEGTMNRSSLDLSTFSKDDLEQSYLSQDLFLTQPGAGSFHHRDLTQHYSHQHGMRCGKMATRNQDDDLDNKAYVGYLQSNELPHPRKLFNRKRRSARRKLLSDPINTQSRKTSQNAVDLHLMQLRIKQRCGFRGGFGKATDDMLATSEEREDTKPADAPADAPVLHENVLHDSSSEVFEAEGIKSDDNINPCNWDDVESWIYNRWKSKTYCFKQLEEE